MDLTLKARVRDGRLILDEPIDLPDGTEVRLIIEEPDEVLADAERIQLSAQLERSIGQIDAGLGVSADEVFRSSVESSDE